MAFVDVRWRPSGGRGEYEFVPGDALLGKTLVVDAVTVPNGFFETDITGYIRDGKPRLRRANPHDRSTLNVAPLVAALALLPAPRREDKGSVRLPLTEKDYVVSSITFEVSVSGNIAFATPKVLKVLHYEYEIDLSSRLARVREALPQMVGTTAAALAQEYLGIVASRSPSRRLQELSTELAGWMDQQVEPIFDLEIASDEVALEAPAVQPSKLEVAELSAHETARKLISHFKIDRSRKLRVAKVAQHLNTHGNVACENCTFDYSVGYGAWGQGFIEVHHRKQLALLMPNEKTYLSDLMLLCANCHRMVHRKQPPLSPEKLAQLTLLKPGYCA